MARRYEKAPKIRWPPVMHDNPDRFADGELYALALHPAVAGLGCRPRAVCDEDWVASVVRLCSRYGPVAVFRDLLLLLRQTYDLWKSEERPIPPDVPAQKKTTVELPRPSCFRNTLNADQDRWMPQDVMGILCNPVAAGIGPYPGIVPDDQWVQAVVKLSSREGMKQILVNVLACLRQTFGGGGFS
jgi:hypothetical protein